MGNFKKLPCVSGCAEDSGFIDCNGNPILTGASLATCADIESGVQTLSLNGTHLEISGGNSVDLTDSTNYLFTNLDGSIRVKAYQG